MCEEVSAYFSGLDGFRIILGQSSLASEDRIPVLIPNALASYEQVIIHEPCFPFVTATGFPCNSRLSLCSIDAKNAFMSTCKIIFFQFIQKYLT